MRYIAPLRAVTEGLGVACEETMDLEIIEQLKSMGHDLQLEAPDNAFGFGGAQLIARLDNGVYVGGSESRKDGLVAGF